jgi:hypothetical protein
MNDIFHEFLGDFVISYLDDILIFPKNKKNDEKHVRMVLQKLRNVGLYAKLEKCVFHKLQMKLRNLFYRSKEDSDSYRMEKAEVSLRFTIFPWFCKLLLIFYPRLFKDCWSIDAPYLHKQA